MNEISENFISAVTKKRAGFKTIYSNNQEAMANAWLITQT